MKVILVQHSKFFIVALDYDKQLYNLLSTARRAELLAGNRRMISKRLIPVKPFSEQVIATAFKDHYIKDTCRFFKGTKKECEDFIEFYMNEDNPTFSPDQFVLYTKFGNTLKYKNYEEFLKAINNV